MEMVITGLEDIAERWIRTENPSDEELLQRFLRTFPQFQQDELALSVLPDILGIAYCKAKLAKR
jgi:hypothetical protein